MRTVAQIKDELRTVVDRGLAAGEIGDKATVKTADEQAIRLHAELKTAEREHAILGIGGIRELGDGRDLATAIVEAGWSRTGRSAVTVDVRYATAGADLRLKSGSMDGAIEDATPARYGAPALGLDARYLFPRLRTESVAFDATGVQSYRQKSRTLADPSDMVKAIDSTSAKEETDTVAEAVSEPLKMVANVQTGTPNILLANDSFKSWVNADLLGGWRAAVDGHIVDEVSGAGIGSGGGGSNAFEDVLYSMETVRSAGYAPDIIAVSPADALAIQLLVMSGGDTYAFAQQLPSFVITTAVGDGEGFVADSQALGVLFLGPFSFATFEEANGTTNSSTVRGESAALFLVQRPDAAATLAGAS